MGSGVSCQGFTLEQLCCDAAGAEAHVDQPDAGSDLTQVFTFLHIQSHNHHTHTYYCLILDCMCMKQEENKYMSNNEPVLTLQTDRDKKN